MVKFTNMAAAGLLPQMLDENDPRRAVEQLHANYGHGGGWHDFVGFGLERSPDGEVIGLSYPGDPVTLALSEAKLRDEQIVLLQYSWVAVIQEDGSFRVARMD